MKKTENDSVLLHDEELVGASGGAQAVSRYAEMILASIESGDECTAVEDYRVYSNNGLLDGNDELQIKGKFIKKFGHTIFDSPYWRKYFDC